MELAVLNRCAELVEGLPAKLEAKQGKMSLLC